MDIDPRLREPSHAASQSYSALPPPSYPLNPIRLPPPPPPQQQQQQQQQIAQQHQAGLPPWPQDGSHPYYAYRPDQQPHNLPPPDIHPHHDPTFTPSQQGDNGFSESKRPRACEACRGLKVRCEPDPVKRTCRRCAKAGRTCVVTAPSRKRQKKTDSRVAELEKKIDALTASLHATKGQGASDSDDEDSYEEMEQQSNDIVGQGAGRKRRISEYQQDAGAPDTRMPVASNNYMAGLPPSMPPDSSNIHPFLMAETARPPPPAPMGFSPRPPHISSENADVIDRNILDVATAFEIFNHYAKDMASHLPIVVFSTDVVAENIRKSMPTLFLAILSVASGQDHSSLQPILAKEIMRTFADRIVCNGEKSLELVQALQVSAIWYWPENERDTKQYQLVHMAAVMSIDLGMDRLPKPAKEEPLAQSYQRLRAPSVSSETAECKRAWLGCYFLCANAAMGLRRPNLIKWDSYTNERLLELESMEGTLPSDKFLALWIRLQRIADDAGQRAVRDGISVLSLSDSKVSSWLPEVGEEMLNWKTLQPNEASSLPLSIEFFYANLCLQDFALNLDYSRKTSKASPTQGGRETDLDSPAPTHQAALGICIDSLHGILTTFMAFTPQDVRTIPTSVFARVAYATILLIKLHLAASTRNSKLGTLVSETNFHLPDCVAGLINLLRASAENGKSRPAHNFSLVMAMLQVWYQKQVNERPSSQNVATNAEPEQKLANGEHQSSQAASASQEHHHQPHDAPTLGQTPLHLLSEVAMGNSGPNNPPTPNGSEVPFDASSAQANSTNATRADAWPPPMVGDGLRRMHPGFEQALGITLAGVGMDIMEDDGFFDLMQRTSEMFEGGGL